MRSIISFLFLVVIGFVAPQFVYADHYPEPTGFVNDFAGALGGRAGALETRLQQYEQETGNEIGVVTLPAGTVKSFEDEAQHIFEQWEVGKKGQDNGALILFVPSDNPNERGMRIEVGYGLEPYMTDIAASLIGNEVVQKYFKDKAYGEGMQVLVEQIIKSIDDSPIQPFTATGAVYDAHGLLGDEEEAALGSMLQKLEEGAYGDQAREVRMAVIKDTGGVPFAHYGTRVLAAWNPAPQVLPRYLLLLQDSPRQAGVFIENRKFSDVERYMAATTHKAERLVSGFFDSRRSTYAAAERLAKNGKKLVADLDAYTPREPITLKRVMIWALRVIAGIVMLVLLLMFGGRSRGRYRGGGGGGGGGSRGGGGFKGFGGGRSGGGGATVRW